MPQKLTNQFKHRITFQQFVNNTNENGFPLEEWQDVKSVWAMIKTLQGREFFQAASVQAEIISRFVIRYTVGITNEMRIIYKGRTFEIIAPPINDDEMNKTLTIVCKELV